MIIEKIDNMKILAIIGTNRRHGSITRMCKQILLGAREKGHQTELINLYDYTINHCIGCWKCSKTGKCHFNDDFTEVYFKEQEADIIILGCPVYWGDVPGIVKDFIDRHTALMTVPEGIQKIGQQKLLDKVKFALNGLKNFGPKKPQDHDKKFLFVIAATCPFRRLLNEIPPTISTLKIFTKKMAGKLKKKLIYTDTLIRFRNKEERIMKKAYTIGKNL